MVYHRVSDWDSAYANGPNIAGGERWPAAWVEPAAAFRDRLTAANRARLEIAYGPARETLDLFLPEATPAGLVVYVHGGYWMRFDKSFWSHLAAGPLAHGFAVAMPSYPLCPDVGIATITQAVAMAVTAAVGLVPSGPLHLTGHSAGGHLAARMVCADSGLPRSVRARIGNVVPISGVHDLRPLLQTAMRETLRLDLASARAESPALLEPLPGIRLTCWVGAGERAEFIRQNALLANAWTGLGAAVQLVEEPDRHHFNVVDGLADPDHSLTRVLVAA